MVQSGADLRRYVQVGQGLEEGAAGLEGLRIPATSIAARSMRLDPIVPLRFVRPGDRRTEACTPGSPSVNDNSSGTPYRKHRFTVVPYVPLTSTSRNRFPEARHLFQLAGFRGDAPSPERPAPQDRRIQKKPAPVGAGRGLKTGTRDGPSVQKRSNDTGEVVSGPVQPALDRS